MKTETMDHLEVIKAILESTPNAGGLDNLFRNALILAIAELTRLRTWENMSKVANDGGPMPDNYE